MSTRVLLFRCLRRTWILALLSAGGLTGASAAERWWSDAVEQALHQAGTNRASLVQALQEVPAPRRDGMQFLVQHMPERDLLELSSRFLLENVTLAYDMFEKAPWAKSVPASVFLNDVLPYASLNERRDDWRKLLIGKCSQMITNCATPSEAAKAINQKLFKVTNVKYSTARRSADQGPLESMESGLATCTGLSILLVDACRAMGVPARVTATPMWSNNRGNHTWVEIWDDGWHFTGAAEQDPIGMDRGWFRGEASQAQKDVPRHAIYSSSFARTGLSFPLAWAPQIAWVNAENVTDRYAAKTLAVDTNKLRLEVKILDRPSGPRVAAKVIVTDSAEPAKVLEGTSRDESADLNNFLSFDLSRGRAYKIAVEQGGKVWRREFLAAVGTNRQEMLVVALNEPEISFLPTQVCYVRPPVKQGLRSEDERTLREAVRAYFKAPTNEQAIWKFSSRMNQLLSGNDPAVREAVWQEYRSAPLHQTRQEDFATNRVQFGKYVSAYTVKTVGERPAQGWAMFIAMHGGGGTAKAVNDSQWQVMQRYYKDHPEAGGYRYVALRAPNDSWNGFYDTYVYPLVANLIRQFLLYGDVDPNKVFIMGYSHGGYGAYAIGPKIPDRFAAVHASAAAATDGETTPKTLRNTIFTAMVGEKDTAYGRYDRNKRFKESVEKLRGDRTDIYPVKVEIIAGNGHTGLPDRDKIASMYPAVRNPVPRELTWLQTDTVIRDFFWLQSPEPGKNREINASCLSNHVTVTTTTNVAAVAVMLDQRLVDFSRPVEFQVNGQARQETLAPDLKVLCDSLLTRGDPDLAFTARVELPLAKPPVKAP